MQLYILNRNPEKSALLIPNKYKFKMLLELAQLISTLTNNGIYKPIKQGKELVQWIDKNRGWVYRYYNKLLDFAKFYVNMSPETQDKLERILASLNCAPDDTVCPSIPEEAVFRYSLEYSCSVPSKTPLLIDECIYEYMKYLNWKLSK